MDRALALALALGAVSIQIQICVSTAATAAATRRTTVHRTVRTIWVRVGILLLQVTATHLDNAYLRTAGSAGSACIVCGASEGRCPEVDPEV